MAVEILGAGVLGVLAILIFGGLLALAGFYLPRLLKVGDARLEGRWGLGEMDPGFFERTEPVPALETARPAPAFPPREPLAGRIETAPDDPLLAAAIALALALEQQKQTTARRMEAALPGVSSWALSGRWQAMQARINVQKR
jgi:hypothetical protein